MAASSSASCFLSSSFFQTQPLHNRRQLSPLKFTKSPNSPLSLVVRAAKLPPGVEVPKVQPKFQAPFLGFTSTAEIWNSRACMIGLIGTFILELILNKGLLQIIGVEVGKGLDLPL